MPIMILSSRCLPTLLSLALLAALGSGCTKAARANRHLSRANQHYEAGQYDKAEIGYLNVLKLSPLKPAAVSRLGLIYHTEGKLLPALAYLQKAAELDPENLEVRVKLGVTSLSLRNLKEARKQAKHVLEKQPANEEAFLLLVDSASGPKEIQETQQWIDKAPPQVRNTAAYHLALGSVHLRQQDLPKAEAEFKQAVALDPKSSSAHQALGNLYLLRNDPKQAGPELKTAADLAPLRSARRFVYARFLLNTGAVDEAKKSIEELNRQVPDYIPAWTFLAELAFAQRKNEECASLVQKLLAKDPTNYDGLLLKGNLMLAKGEGTNAVTHFERVTKTVFGQVPQVHYQLALAQLMNKDVTKAMGTLNRAINLNTNFAQAILLLSELNLRTGNSAPAVTALTRLTKEQPQVAQAHLLLAQAHLVQKNPQAALGVYARMAQLFPKSAQVPLLMGQVLAQQNQRTEARKAFEKALELSPDFVPALEQLVDLDLLDKKYANATERIKQAMSRTPDAAEPWLLTAKVHMAQNDLKQAESALLKASEKNPNLSMPYLLLARIYLNSNQQQQALARLNELVEKKTNNVAALMQIGMIQDAQKNYPAAREAYEKLLAINPRFGVALNNLAYLYSERMGEHDKAAELAERARALAPQDPATADTLGWILYRKGEFPRALSLLQESAAKLPTDPEIQFHLGMVHYMLGEQEPARLCLQRAVQGNKDFSGKDEAQRRLALLAIDVKTADAAALAGLEKRVQEEPNDSMALGLLAAIYERNGAAEKAVKTYEKALSQNPRNARAMARLAELYVHLKDTAKALEMAKNAHNLVPEDARISHTLGRLVYQTGDHKWAASLLTECARSFPKDPGVLTDLAWCQYSLGQVASAAASMQAAQAGLPPAQASEASRFLALVAAAGSASQAQAAAAQAEAALKADPNYVPALVVSALLQEQQGKPKDAAQLYERILTRYPLFAPATRNLALVYSKHLAEDPKAYELATKARTAFPEDPEVAKALGVLAFRRGDFARSTQLLNESARKRTTDGELMYYLGMAHYRLQQRKQSKDALQRALSLQVPAKLADEARRVIAELK